MHEENDGIGGMESRAKSVPFYNTVGRTVHTVTAQAAHRPHAVHNVWYSGLPTISYR